MLEASGEHPARGQPVPSPRRSVRPQVRLAAALPSSSMAYACVSPHAHAGAGAAARGRELRPGEADGAHLVAALLLARHLRSRHLGTLHRPLRRQPGRPVLVVHRGAQRRRVRGRAAARDRFDDRSGAAIDPLARQELRARRALAARVVFQVLEPRIDGRVARLDRGEQLAAAPIGRLRGIGELGVRAAIARVGRHGQRRIALVESATWARAVESAADLWGEPAREPRPHVAGVDQGGAECAGLTRSDWAAGRQLRTCTHCDSAHTSISLRVGSWTDGTGPAVAVIRL